MDAKVSAFSIRIQGAGTPCTEVATLLNIFPATVVQWTVKFSPMIQHNLQRWAGCAVAESRAPDSRYGN